LLPIGLNKNAAEKEISLDIICHDRNFSLIIMTHGAYR